MTFHQAILSNSLSRSGIYKFFVTNIKMQIPFFNATFKQIYRHDTIAEPWMYPISKSHKYDNSVSGKFVICFFSFHGCVKWVDQGRQLKIFGSASWDIQKLLNLKIRSWKEMQVLQLSHNKYNKIFILLYIFLLLVPRWQHFSIYRT